MVNWSEILFLPQEEQGVTFYADSGKIIATINYFCVQFLLRKQNIND